jgi:hypothetical protein
MSKDFLMFVMMMTIAVILLFPYSDTTWESFFRLFGGIVFAAIAGAFNYKDLKRIYKERLGE